MSGQLEYKGYKGSIDYTPEDGVLFGKVLGITSLLLYEGESIEAIKKDFMDAVDDYLLICKEEGFEPEIPVIAFTDNMVKPSERVTRLERIAGVI